MTIGREQALLLDTMKGDQCIAVALQWLDSEKSGSWRLIVENVDELAHGIESLLPQNKGVILFTSRNIASLETFGIMPLQIHRVQAMTPLIAADLLLKLTERSTENDEDTDKGARITNDHQHAAETQKIAEALVKELDCLPLAIAQAAAYLRIHYHITMEEYTSTLKAYADHEHRTHFMKPFTDVSNRSGGSQRIMMTWDISRERIVKVNPQAQKLLQVFSVLSPENVPRSVLRFDSLKALRFDSSDDIQEAVGVLLSYSLISVNTAHGYHTQFKMHRLVSLWTRSTIEDENAISAAALDMVVEAFPLSTVGDNLEGTEMSKHFEALTRNFPPSDHDIWTTRAGRRMSYKMGRHLYTTGEYVEAAKHLSSALEYFNSNEPTSEEALDCRFYLGWVQKSQSKFKKALENFEKVYEERSQAHGEEDAAAINISTEIARTLTILGQKTDAHNMLAKALDLKKRTDPIPNFDKQEYLPIVEGLGEVCQASGEFEQAAKWFRHGLQGALERYRAHSVVTFNMTFNLMETLRAAGHEEEATNVLDNFMEEFKKSFPQSIQQQSSSGATSQGELLEIAFPVACTVWGETSIRALDYMDYMAIIMFDEGRTIKSLDLHRKAFDLAEQRYTIKHHLTLAIANNLATNLAMKSEYPEALKYLTLVESGSLALFEGRTNAMSISAMEKLARINYYLGAYDDAKVMVDNLLLITELETIKDQENLGDEMLAALDLKGSIYRELGRFDEAIKSQEIALIGFTKRHKLNGRLSLGVRTNLAETMVEGPNSAEALPILAEVIETTSSKPQPPHFYEMEIEARIWQSRAWLKTGSVNKALAQVEKLLLVAQDHSADPSEYSPSESHLADLYFTKGMCLEHLERWEEVIKCYDRARSLRQDRFGLHHPSTLTSALAKAFPLSRLNPNESSDTCRIFLMAQETFGKSLIPSSVGS